jgi:hypothetical protein|nr:MAG TPA: hypothetical protein [Caudoviricetes sp.]
MRTLFFSLFLFVPLFFYGQKIESVTIDDFENIKIVKTTVEKLSKETLSDTKGQSMFYFESQGNRIYFHLLWQCRGTYVVPQGENAYFLFDDGSKIELKSAADALPVAGIASTAWVKPGKVLGLDIPYYSMDITEVIDKKVVKIRIKTTDGVKDFEVLSKNQKKISEALKLVIQEMDL